MIYSGLCQEFITWFRNLSASAPRASYSRYIALLVTRLSAQRAILTLSAVSTTFTSAVGRTNRVDSASLAFFCGENLAGLCLVWRLPHSQLSLAPAHAKRRIQAGTGNICGADTDLHLLFDPESISWHDPVKRVLCHATAVVY